MKKHIFVLFALLVFSAAKAQPKSYQDGEWLKLRIHYGWFNASYATLEVEEKKIGSTPVMHVKGNGKSTGVLHAFFKVDDTYESKIDKETGLPYEFVRDINEGGYTKNKIINFNHKAREAKVRDLKHNKTEVYDTQEDVQDMISAFYYLRDQIPDNMQEGDEIVIDMFFDEENYKFKTVFLGEETIKTKFGKKKAYKFRPHVQSGRVFKEKESLTVWISADKNRLPLKIKAKLAVGSLKADIDGYKNLKHPFDVSN